jgi:hypothetical protein
MIRKTHRRRLLQALAGGLVTGTGCLGGDTPPATNATDASSSDASASGSTETSPTFDAVTADGGRVVARLGSDTRVDQVKLVGPAGTDWGEKTIPPSGVVSIEIPLGYVPGQHRIVAIQNGRQVDRATVDLVPVPHLRSVGHAADLPPAERRSVIDQTDQAFVRVENTGTAPALVSGFTASGRTPRQRSTDVPGIAELHGDGDDVRDVGRYDVVPVLPGERRTLFTRQGFLFPAVGAALTEECTRETQVEQFQFTLHTRHAGELTRQVSYRYRVERDETAGTTHCAPVDFGLADEGGATA